MYYRLDNSIESMLNILNLIIMLHKTISLSLGDKQSKRHHICNFSNGSEGNNVHTYTRKEK